MNKAIFITSRANSTRLPDKWKLEFAGQSTLGFLIDQTKKSINANKIVLCTSDHPSSDELALIAQNKNILCFRGSENDKLDRWNRACQKYEIDFFVTVDGDDLFCEMSLVDLAFSQFDKNNSDFIRSKNIICGAFTYGIKSSILNNVCNIKDSSDTEMIEGYFIDSNLCKVEELEHVHPNYKREDIRMTLDYEDDYLFFKNVYNGINKNVNLQNIISYIDKNPKVKLLNLFRQQEWKENQINKTKVEFKKFDRKGWRFDGNERKYLSEVLSSGFGASESGSANEKLEVLFAQKHHQNYAIGFNSGTSTLHAALYALGVGVGDEVLVPNLTVAMCGFAIWQCGATPVFVDVKEDTFLMDPVDIERKVTDKTKAIMVVHLYGLMCEMNKVLKIAKDNNIYIIEDCAQCFLAKDDKGRISGTIGDVGSWSFENSKHLSSGDGGIVTTDNSELARKIRQFGGVGFKNLTATSGKVRIDRDKFQNPNWERHNILAYNYRLPELCAAVALAQTERIEYFCNLRIKMALEYEKVIKETNTQLLTPQVNPPGYKNSYYTYACLFNSNLGISWEKFRLKYIKYGGDGVFAAWKNMSQEPCFRDNKIGYGETPVALKIQKDLMQFTTNQQNKTERSVQVNALIKTLNHFNL